MSNLPQCFPLLNDENHQITSPSTPFYNCAAWAAEDSGRWWWPDAFGLCYWPPDASREESLDAFERAYSVLGYEVCEDGALEDDLEKVAIFADRLGNPTHVARQLPNGRWTSKCGKLEDIEHDLVALTGESYGSVVRYMKRLGLKIALDRR